MGLQADGADCMLLRINDNREAFAVLMDSAGGE